MSDLESRHQQPLPDTILDIRRLLLTPNPEPRYPQAESDAAERSRNRRRLIRSRLRSD